MKKLLVLGIMVLSVAALFAGISHDILGYVEYVSGGNPEGITFNAYITIRPDEIITETTVGCGYGAEEGYDVGMFGFNVGNFPSDWDAGEIAHIDVTDLLSGNQGSAEIVLNYEGYQLLPDPIIIDDPPVDLYPPTNLTALVYLQNNVRLEWDAPVDPNAIELYYDDGVAENQWYVDDPPASTNHLAVGFTYTEDCFVNYGKFAMSYDPSATSFDWNLFGGSSAGPDVGSVLASGTCDLDGDPEGAWYTVDLGGIAVTAGDWFYLDVQYRDGMVNGTDCYFCGGDASEIDPFSWYSLDEISWTNLATTTDLMIRAIVSVTGGKSLTINPVPTNNPTFVKDIASMPKISPEFQTKIKNIKFATPQIGNAIDRDFLNYIVYRDGAGIATPTTTEYEDLSLADGTYEYYVTAFYDDGESEPTNTVSVDIEFIPPGPILIDEDFEVGAIPPGWDMTTNSAQGWWVTTDGTSTYWTVPAGDGYYACSNDDLANDDGSMDYLITPYLDLSEDYVSLNIDFDSYFTAVYSQTAHFEVSIDDGPWTVIEEWATTMGDSWTTISIDLSAYCGIGFDNVRFAFHSNDNGAWASGWAVDNVLLEGVTGGYVEGYVYDTASNPLEGASLIADDVEYAITNSDGFYSFAIGSGTYNLTASKFGYISYTEDSVEVSVGETTYVDFYLEPATAGDLEGIVTDIDTGDPIEGALISILGTELTATTDTSGYYLFEGVYAGLYDIEASHSDYSSETVEDFEIIADETGILDFELEIKTAMPVTITVEVDYWELEATWNLYNYATGEFHYPEDQTFSEAYEIQVVDLDLELGLYAIYCYDTYGDGGIAGEVVEYEIELVSWAASDYTTDGVFDFEVISLERGTLAGYVTELSTGIAIEGALVTCGLNEGTTDEGGYYEINEILVGTYDGVTCEVDGYNIATADGVEIIEDETTLLDFALTAPTIEVEPLFIEETMDPETTMTTYLTVSNNGNGPLDWDTNILYPDKAVPTYPSYTEIIKDMYLNRVKSSPSCGLAPTMAPNSPLVNSITPRDEDSEAFAYMAYDPGGTIPEGPISFYLNDPSILTPFGSAASDFVGTADWVDDTWYGIVYGGTLISIDMEDGTITTIGSTADATGMAYDWTTETMYAAGFYGELWTIDLADGSYTQVTTTQPNLITMTCSNDGILYGFDLSTDTFGMIDKDTGAWTEISAVGFDFSYAQDASFDHSTNTLYWACYDVALGGLLLTVDLETGVTSLVGAFPNGAEVTGFAIPGAPVTGPIVLEPDDGTIEVGGSCEVAMTVSSFGILPGTDIIADIIFTSEPDVGTETVDVIIHVGPLTPGSVSGTVTLNGGDGNVEEVLITAESTTGLLYETNPDADGDYSLDIYPGTYDLTATLEFYEDYFDPDITIGEDEHITRDITLDAFATVMVYGRVVGNDAPDGLPDALVELFGDVDYSQYTDGSGNFIFLEVYANQTYDVEITCEGYQPYSGFFEVGDVDYDAGEIIVYELMLPPCNLAVDDTLTQGALYTWDAPVPGGDEIDEGFEDNFPPDGWTIIDNDGDSATEGWWGTWSAYEYSPHSGTICAASASYNNDSYNPLTPDNWMITPSIACGGSSELHFWAAAQDNAYPADHYAVRISTSGTDVADFTDTVFEETLENDTWHEVVVGLSDYAGQTIHIAWNHCDSYDMFVMKIDDISVINAVTKEVLFSADFETEADFIKFKHASKRINSDRSLQGYNVYLDTNFIDFTSDLEYLVPSDILTFGQEYLAGVTAVYSGGAETDPITEWFEWNPSENYPPTADAGEDQTVVSGELVTLDGSASDDPNDDPITYLWTAPDGIELSDPTAVSPTFVAPPVEEDTDFVFSLVVSDYEFDSEPDTVVITVTPPFAIITIGSVNAGAGEEFDIPISTTELTEEDNVISFQFDFFYDATIIEYNSFALTEMTEEGMAVVNDHGGIGQLSVSYMNMYPIFGEGDLIIFTFTVLVFDSTDITIDDFLYNDIEIPNIIPGVVNGIIWGDVDCDGSVTAYDAALTLQFSAGIENPDFCCQACADVDGDDSITAYDAALILQYSADIIDEFPVESGRETMEVNAKVNVKRVQDGLYISTSDLSAQNVIAFQFDLNYDKDVEYIDYKLGSITAGGEVAINADADTPGYLRVSYMNKEALKGEGTIIKLEFDGQLSDYSISNFMLNKSEIEPSYAEEVVKLYGNYPNPFNSNTTISFSLPNDVTEATIEIYNVKGQLVHKVTTQDEKVEWNPENQASGIYFYKLTAGNQIVTKKMILMK